MSLQKGLFRTWPGQASLNSGTAQELGDVALCPKGRKSLCPAPQFIFQGESMNSAQASPLRSVLISPVGLLALFSDLILEETSRSSLRHGSQASLSSKRGTQSKDCPEETSEQQCHFQQHSPEPDATRPKSPCGPVCVGFCSPAPRSLQERETKAFL